MQAIWPLGNDVVDLRLPDNQKSAANPRYIKRVISSQERDAPAFVAGNNRIFWTYWAAKEAAYKALVKTDPALIFSHRLFQVFPEQPTSLHDNHGSATGVVRYAAVSVPVSWVWNEDWVHCLTVGDTDQPIWRIGAVDDYLSHAAFEHLKKTSSLADATVVNRLLAQSLLDEWGLEDGQIVRPKVGLGSGPPQLEHHGKIMTGIDISLSHDGRYSAAALRLNQTSTASALPRSDR